MSGMIDIRFLPIDSLTSQQIERASEVGLSILGVVVKGEDDIGRFYRFRESVHGEVRLVKVLVSSITPGWRKRVFNLRSKVDLTLVRPDDLQQCRIACRSRLASIVEIPPSKQIIFDDVCASFLRERNGSIGISLRELFKTLDIGLARSIMSNIRKEIDMASRRGIPVVLFDLKLRNMFLDKTAVVHLGKALLGRSEDFWLHSITTNPLIILNRGLAKNFSSSTPGAKQH